MPDDLPPLHDLYHAAVLVARREDAEVRGLVGDGIFSVPELAYAYLVGKEAVAWLRSGSDRKVQWERERSLGGAGPTDLVLTVDGLVVAVEFKVAGTYPAYERDVEKLAASGAGAGVFVALVDRFAGAPDPRVAHVDGLRGTTRARPEFEAFPTRTRRYTRPVECEVAMWAVNVPAP